tara:strand:- start:177 stop:416 length:240 start_codon:yes stop_codon:yes gene_type:complete
MSSSFPISISEYLIGSFSTPPRRDEVSSVEGSDAYRGAVNAFDVAQDEEEEGGVGGIEPEEELDPAGTSAIEEPFKEAW